MKTAEELELSEINPQIEPMKTETVTKDYIYQGNKNKKRLRRDDTCPVESNDQRYE